MSHHFKAPASIDPQERRDDRQVKLMASQITNQGMLETLLKGATPVMRAAMIERLTPYLGFVPEDEAPIPDCLGCGLYRGSVIPHLCLGPN